jgi:hypothetical protein
MALAPFITLAEMKSRLIARDGSISSQNDVRLQDCINAASADIERTCNRSFAYGTRTDTFNTVESARMEPDLHGFTEWGTVLQTGCQCYTLSCSPVDTTKPITVLYDPTWAFSSPRAVVDPSRVNLDTETGRIVLLQPTRRASRSLRVSFTAGYPPDGDGTMSGSLPSELKLACAWQALYLWHKVQGNNIGLAASRPPEKGAPVKFAVDGGLVPEALALVLPWRRTLTGRG